MRAIAKIILYKKQIIYNSFTSIAGKRLLSNDLREFVILQANIKEDELYLNEVLSKDFQLKTDFISKDEQEILMQEVDKSFRRTKYQYDHWDGAIHGFRETEKSKWNDKNDIIIEKIKNAAFDASKDLIPATHILDLAGNGHIKPHTDSIKFCGTTIAGLSLLSTSIMRYCMNKDKSVYVDVLLPPLSLYIMKNKLRYDFTHELLSDEEAYWGTKHLPRSRRVSVLLRNEP